MKKIWYILIAALVLAACSEDSEQREDTASPLYLTHVTRASSDISISDADEEQAPIQVFIASGSKQTEGQFVYDAGKWTSTIGVKETMNYIYGFSPATVAFGEISMLPGATDYSGGAVLTLSNLSAVTGDDVCVVVGVEKSQNPVTPNFGTFQFKKEDPNYVCLLLDHVYAGVDFKFKIGKEYHEMREIRLKKMELQAVKTVKKAIVTVKANTTDTNPITSINYETENNSEQAPIYDYEADTRPENSRGMLLTEDGVTILGCFAPDKTIANSLVLTCTYDVYNKKGTCVRENCTAINDLSGMSEDTVERGKKSKIVLTIEPTYLYALSDDELNNPTITISN